MVHRWTQSEFCTWQNSVREQEPPKMYMYSAAAQETAKHRAVWLASGEWRRCSNEAKTRNRLKFAGVPQTGTNNSAISGPTFAILWGHLEEILLFNKFFPTVDVFLRCKDIVWQSCVMPRWQIFGDFLRSVFSASRVQYVSDLHPKFALRPHRVWKYGRHPICNGRD